MTFRSPRAGTVLCTGDLAGVRCPRCGAHFHVAHYVWLRFWLHPCPHCHKASSCADLEPERCAADTVNV